MRFNLADVFLPDAKNSLIVAPDELVFEGIIVGFSDSGDKARLFAMVDVTRKCILVVPTNKLQVVSMEGLK